MKRFLTAFFLACLSLFVSCGTKGPQIVQKEGFVLVHDTLSLDLRPLVLPGCRLSFEQAVKVGEDYLCLFQQQNVYDRFKPPIRTNLLLRVAPETGSFHEVAQPCPVMAEERLVMCKDTVYLIVEQPTGQYRFIPEEETWEDGSFNEDVVYEDADWSVVTRDIRYAGSHTWFIERKTGKEYFFFTKPGQILPYNGYYYLTDPERFRGIADPHEGFLCDSTSTYEAIMKDCPDCSFNVIHSLVESGGRSFKTAADIYAFGEGDEWSGCEYSHRVPDTLFNASFLAKGSLYQMVTTPSSSYVAQVTAHGLNWIIDLGKRYKTWGAGTVKNYQDDANSFGIIELGDTLRFLHIRHNVDSLAYTGDIGLENALKVILRHRSISEKRMKNLMNKAGFSFVSSYSATCDDGFIYCKVADADWTGWARWEFSVPGNTLNSIELVQGLTPYFDGAYHKDRKWSQEKAKRQELIDMVSRIVGQEPTLTEYGERIWTTGRWSIFLPDGANDGFGVIKISQSTAM